MIQISQNGRWPSNHVRLGIMWENNPRCVWCDNVTVFFETHVPILPDHAATVDHLYPATDGRRIKHKKSKMPSHLVLACSKCNGRRGNTQYEHFEVKMGVTIDFENVYF